MAKWLNPQYGVYSVTNNISIHSLQVDFLVPNLNSKPVISWNNPLPNKINVNLLKSGIKCLKFETL